MRVRVHMFFDFECLVVLLQVHANAYVECLVLVGERVVVCVFHVTAGIHGIQFGVHSFTLERLIYVLQAVETSLQIYERALQTVLVHYHQGRHTCGFGHECVVRTERRSNVYDTSTVLRGNIVSQDDAESTLARIDVWH